MQKKRKREQGFSLVELMVVIAILGILATTVTIAVSGRSYSARKGQVKTDMSSIKKAVTMYKSETGTMPNRLEDLQQDPGVNGWSGPYLEDDPIDPWGNPYVFEYPASTGEYDLISYGADGTSSGQEEGADLRMSELLTRRTNN